MGILDRVRGVRRPPEGRPAKTAEEMFAALLAVNDPTKPYSVRPADIDGVDLMGEWRMTEPAWNSFFLSTGMDRTFQTLMRLDPENREVRTVDKQWKVTWFNGAPEITLAKEWGRGNISEVSWRKTIERDENGEFIAKEEYRFSTKELKDPLIACTVAAGWTWRPVPLGRL